MGRTLYVTPEINRADEELKINLNLPSKTEIKHAIKMLKKAKASGPDNIPPEALKANPDLTAKILHKIYSDIWKNEVSKLPKAFSKSTKLRNNEVCGLYMIDLF
jgi:hypothetical protein